MPSKRISPTITVEVTADLINDAVRRSSSHCMISEAIKRAIPTAKSVSTDLATIRWTDPDLRLRYTGLTPRAAQRALLRFDRGDETIEPFSFRLRAALVTTSQTGMERPKRERATLRQSGHHDSPERIGGSAPPLGALSSKKFKGQRREFGLRSASR